MKRAYSTIEIKAMEGEGNKRTFTGIASTPTADRSGDIVLPKGAKFKLPIPLLWQHNSSKPIGWVTEAKVTSAGIEIKCEVADIPDDGDLKKRLDEAWQAIKYKLVRGLSIGFNPLKYSRIAETYSYEYQEWEWLELSAVTIPANSDASIQSIKSVAKTEQAASGQHASKAPVLKSTPDASGNSSNINPKGILMKTLQELREERAQKAARQNELMELRKSENNRRFTSDEATEFDALAEEIGNLDDDIRVKQYELSNAAAATPIQGKSSEEGSRSRAGVSFVRKQDPDDKFKGQAFTRLAIAKAASFIALKDGNFISPAQIAEKRWGKSHPNMVNWIKAAVAGGGTGSGEWGAELAQSDTRFNGDFIEFLYSMTIFDRLPLRAVPARVHIKGQDGAATGYWVGESKAIPVSKPDFSDVELTPLKVGAIAVCSKELIADSDPSAELWIRDSIVQASAQRVDTTFLGAAAASGGVSPAGILNGLSLASPSGTDADAVRADLMTLYSAFLAAKNASGLVQIMTPSMAKALQMLRNSLGQREFPDIRADGGTLEGDQVFTGDNVTPGNWILLKPSDIWKIGDSGIELSMSDTATIEQNDAPQGAGDTPTAASATVMSLWQTEQVGFKLTRRINYAKRRASAVAGLQDAEYGGVVS